MQAAGIEALQGDQSGALAILAELERRGDATGRAELQTISGFVIAKPDSTFYLFPNVTEGDGPRARRFHRVAGFTPTGVAATGVSFCARHFGRPLPGETRAVRTIARTRAISVDDIQTGIGKLRDWIEAA